MAQKILIIDGHPDPDRARLCHALADAYAKAARDAGKAAQQMKSTLHRLYPATNWSSPVLVESRSGV